MREDHWRTFKPGELPERGSDGYTGRECRDPETGAWTEGPKRTLDCFEVYEVDEKELATLDEVWRRGPRIVRVTTDMRRSVRAEKAKKKIADPRFLPAWEKPPPKKDGGIDPVPSKLRDTSGEKSGAWNDDCEAYCLECHHWIRDKVGHRSVHSHVGWHQSVYKGDKGMVGTSNELDNLTRWKYFTLGAITYNVSLRAMADRRFLPYALGLKGFKLWGRDKIVTALNRWAEKGFEKEQTRLLEHGQTCYVECDTTTQKGGKHVLAQIVHYFDREKRKMKHWCYSVAQYIGESLTSQEIYKYQVRAVANVGFTPAGFTSDSANARTVRIYT
jgi:hypothetical protein